jgi:peptidoglycan-N-acetylglucosamine deacetylase
LKETRPGSIVLAHDIHAQTIQAMPATLTALEAKGFKFVTVSELLKLQTPIPPPTPKPVAPPSTPSETVLPSPSG